MCDSFRVLSVHNGKTCFGSSPQFLSITVFAADFERVSVSTTPRTFSQLATEILIIMCSKTSGAPEVGGNGFSLRRAHYLQLREVDSFSAQVAAHHHVNLRIFRCPTWKSVRFKGRLEMTEVKQNGLRCTAWFMPSLMSSERAFSLPVRSVFLSTSNITKHPWVFYVRVRQVRSGHLRRIMFCAVAKFHKRLVVLFVLVRVQGSRPRLPPLGPTKAS